MDELIPIRQVSEMLPAKPDYMTVLRWANKGIQGVRLESVRIGRHRYTTELAVQRFAKQLTELYDENLSLRGQNR